MTIASMKKSSINSIDSSIGVLSNLLENLKIYRQSMIDCFDLGAEKNNTAAPPIQSHTLHGVVSFQQILKSENDRINQTETDKEKAIQQKRIFWRLIENDFPLLIQLLKQLKNSDAYFEEFLEIIGGNINLSLQPQKPEGKPSAIKPNSIKLNIDQKLNK